MIVWGGIWNRGRWGSSGVWLDGVNGNDVDVGDAGQRRGGIVGGLRIGVAGLRGVLRLVGILRLGGCLRIVAVGIVGLGGGIGVDWIGVVLLGCGREVGIGLGLGGRGGWFAYGG